MNKPRVSIITSFYNAEKFFVKAIESVISQTYTNWELILVDDGSTDNSTLIAKKYAQKYPKKIFYYEHQDHENKGTSASRNLGINFSTGNLITFLDADDLYLNQKLEKQIELIKNYPEVDVIISATKYWFSWENPDYKSNDFIQNLGVKRGSYSPPELLFLMLVDKAVVPCMGGLMVKRSLIEQCRMEEEFKGMFDDQVFYSKLIINGKIYVDDNYHDLYRQHRDSCYSRSKIENTVISYEHKFLSWLEDYVSKNFSKYPQLLRTIKKQLFFINYPKTYTLYRRIRKIKRKILRIIATK